MSGRAPRLLAFALAVVGALVGVGILWLHLTTDPLADFQAYYEAATRLNEGQPLYQPDADPNGPHFYFYPPLFAILVRPLALLPYETAAGVWALVISAAFVATLFRLGVREPRTWLALGILAGPTAWAVAVGQAQVLVTFLLTFAAPWAVALAGQLKILPALVALYWLGRRDWSALGRFVLVSAALLALQLVLAPADTIAFLTFPDLAQVGEVRNLSPYALSPVLWLVLAIGGAAATLVLARSRWGWAAAVVFSVVATPRLLLYMFSTFIVVIRRPAETTDDDAMERGLS